MTDNDLGKRLQFKKLLHQYQRELAQDDIAHTRAVMQLEKEHAKERSRKQEDFMRAIHDNGLEDEYRQYLEDKPA
jgi:hypothetical protein